MPVILDEDVTELLNDDTATKVLATVDSKGAPHLAITRHLHAAEDGTIHYLELLESSKTNANLLRALWFDRPVTIGLADRHGARIEIRGRPVKAHIVGDLFQAHYRSLRETLGDVDLAAVWVIRPEAVEDQSFAVAKAREEADHPVFIHLDRLAAH